MIEIMESEYILYARARGERGWSLIRRHCLRNLMLPAITLQFGSISEIFGGSVLVEEVFSYPGLGQAAITAGLGSDVPLLFGNYSDQCRARISGKYDGGSSVSCGGSQDAAGEEGGRKEEYPWRSIRIFAFWNLRRRTIAAAVISFGLLLFTALLGHMWLKESMTTDFSRKNLSPCLTYPFGTDWLGRDMIKRTMAGLSMSIRLGAVTAGASAVIAVILGTAAAVFGKTADRLISGLINLIQGIPHMLLLILISYGLGKGFRGVAVGIALTHWPSLARLMRAEVMQLKTSQYVKISEKLGMGPVRIAAEHMLPHLIPQFITGLILLFPHAILHEAGITFLGFGLSPEEPAVGIILSESMTYLMTGKWWLAVFPGAALVLVVLLFEWAGTEPSGASGSGQHARIDGEAA